MNICPTCDAKPGELHRPGCTVERCPYCGGQLLLCQHDGLTYPPPDADRMPWTGEWPGSQECREFGWYATRDRYGPGYVSCSADHPQAIPDLNRLMKEAVWDRAQKRFVRKDEAEAKK